jgi:acyl-CoA thioesterase-1
MRSLGWFLLLFCLLFAYRCNQPSGDSKGTPPPEVSGDTGRKVSPADEKKKLILFFGNSLTAGYGLAPEQAYPAHIQTKLDALKPEYKIVNAGLSGDTSADGLGRISFLLEQYPSIHFFVLELGANDGLRGLSLDQTLENLQGIIDRVKTENPEVNIVLAGMEVPPNMGPDYTAQFRKVFTDLASINQTALIPFLLEGVAGEPHLNLDDGIHPNEEGHVIVAENVWAVLKDLL